MKLRSYLVLMILGAILPVAVFGAIAGIFLAQRESETFRRGAHDRVLAVGTAIDLELRSSIDTLHALALAPSLEQGDLRYFRHAASTLLAAHPDWTNINLALPSGQQVMNLMVPDGEPLPNIGALDGSFERLVRTGEPVISDLAVGPVLKRWSFAVRVPVFEKDALKYVLSAGVKPEAINRIVDAQDLPRDWVGVVIDRNGRIVARNLTPEQTVGRLASQSLREGLAREPSGWFRGSTIEGTDVYTPYRRSPVTGWSFAMGIPAYAVDAGTRRAAWLVALWLAGAIAAAFLLAHFMSRRISGPIASLASAVEAVGRGSRVEPPAEPRIDEIRLLAAALRSAAQAARERQDLVAREKEALQAADRAKDEFLATLGHELRNPLAALSAAAHVLKVADPARESAIKARRVVERQTKHMARLIEDLLDISRITMGKATLERELLDLAQVASNVLHTWRSAGRLDGARVSLQVMPIWVSADRVRIEQILANLLDNALKFTPAGQPITVSVRPEGGDAVLQVSDEGEGISPHMIGGLFDLFTQGPHGPDRGKGGLGLGLALVKRLAEMHGGSVSAASEGLGRGAVVTVRLPAVDGPQTQPAASGQARRAAGARRVLVIEDNDDARQMLRATLALAGHEVREAPDGMSGIAAVAEVRPDVVLVDIGLPDIDGYEVARRLRSSAVDGKIALIA